MSITTESHVGKLAHRPAVLRAEGARASRVYAAPNLGIELHDANIGDGHSVLSDGMSHRLAVDGAIQESWKKLPLLLEKERQLKQDDSITDIAVDTSSGSKLIMQGRYMLPEKAAPVYWAIRDNRAATSCAFDSLSVKDKTNLVNQMLKSFAERSEKTDLKCAALAVTEKGQMYIAMNTQETDTMQYDKECAEANLSTIVKQLAKDGDKVKHMYILGGLVDEHGKFRDHGPLISMCMRCVEKTWSIFAPDALVTAIPLQGGDKKFIEVSEALSKQGLEPGVAWQTPYMTLKGPSIIQFAEDVRHIQDWAFEKMLNNKVNYEAIRYGIVAGLLDQKDAKRPSRVRTDERSVLRLFNGQAMELSTINDYMVSQAADSIRKCEGVLDNIEIAMIEVRNSHGGTRYICETEVRGKNHNATTAPVSTAAFHAKLSKKHGEYISHIYMMGYDPQSESYNASCEQWDRAVKRSGNKPESVPVDFLPFNTGWRTSKMDLSKVVQTKTLAELSGGGFIGAKQMNGTHVARQEAEHVHGPACNHR